MKALTALPTQAYVQVGEEANVPLQDLLRLVQELETNVSPAYIARYRPDVAAGLNAERIQEIQNRLRGFLDLADRRVTILTAINQQERLTPELREKIEGSMDRRELEDLYLPFKPKRRTAADDAMDKGLEGLALYLWGQQGDEIEAEAAKYVGEGVESVEAALSGATDIIARWLGENAEIRRDVRKLAQSEAEISVKAIEPKRRLSGRDENQRKRFAAMDGLRAPANKAQWRQVLSLRRGAREGWLEFRVELPAPRALQYLEGRLVKDAGSAFTPHLKAAAQKALDDYLAPTVEKELRQELDERCDAQAIGLYKKNLRKLLLAAPAGPRVLIGLETNRPGGWRAAVIGADGALLEAAIVREDSEAKSEAKPQEEAPKGDAKADDAQPEAAALDAAKAEEAAQQATPPTEEPSQQQAEEEAQPSADGEPNPPETAEQRQPSDVVALEEPVEAAPEAQSADDETADQPTEQSASADQHQVEPAEAEAQAPEPDAATADDPQPEPAPAEQPAEAEAPAAKAVTEAEAAEPAADQAKAGNEQIATPQGGEKPEAPPKKDKPARKQTPAGDLSELIARHQAELVVFGNGPGLRQVERAVRLAVKQSGRDCAWIAVNEAGSWIYATSKGARKEMPDHEPAVRSAACLARRVQDPMGELIKLDPRVLGIGQGHHEVDQKGLRTALREAQEAAVQHVGVDVNAASVELIALVPGMTERVAKRIVDHRRKNGSFQSRKQLGQMSGLNARVYDQAAGFVRISGGENPLDATGIHPRDYAKVEQILQSADVSAQEALDEPSKLAEVDLAALAGKDYSERALEALLRELQARIRNPRGEFRMPQASSEVEPIDEPKVGMKVEGVVTNVADFGLFVDIGAEQDGLVHVSQLASGVTREGEGAVKAGDKLTVYVVNVANGGKRISLSMREPRESSRQRRASPEGRRAAESHRRGRDARRGGRPDRDRKPLRRTFGPDDRKGAEEAQGHVDRPEARCAARHVPHQDLMRRPALLA